MCGMCGISMSPSEELDIDTLAKDMLVEMQSRGADATGLAWQTSENQIWITKSNVPANIFIKDEQVPSDVRTLIGHTRWATKGSPENNNNNHPIDTYGIVGIHNGFIGNDDQLFNEHIGLENRIAEVDSEAAFALLGIADVKVAETLAKLEGLAALAWFNSQTPGVLHLTRVSYSPLVVASTAQGSLLFASTLNCLRNTAVKHSLTLENIEPLKEGTYLAVKDGAIIECSTFDPPKRHLVQSTFNFDAIDYSNPSVYQLNRLMRT